MKTDIKTVNDVKDRIDGNKFAMVTSIDERGTLSARPVTVQEVDDSGDLWFLVDGKADWVRPLDGGPVNASISDDKTWVSFAGRAAIVEDAAKIESLKDPMSESFFEDGAVIVALRIATDQIEWWAAPNKAVQLVEMVKAKATDSEPDLGDSGTINL